MFITFLFLVHLKLTSVKRLRAGCISGLLAASAFPLLSEKVNVNYKKPQFYLSGKTV